MSARDLRTAIALAVAGAEAAGWCIAAGQIIYVTDGEEAILVQGDNPMLLTRGCFVAEGGLCVGPAGLRIVVVDTAPYRGNRFCCPLGAVAICADERGHARELVATNLGVSGAWMDAFAYGFDAADFFPDEPEVTSPSVLCEPSAYELGKRFREAVSP